MSSFIPEQNWPDTKAVFYSPGNRHTRTTSFLIHGWHMNGAKPSHTGTPYGLPILVQEDGTLKPLEPGSNDFMGIAYSADSMGRLQEKARKRWEKWNAIRMKQLAEEKAADDAARAEEADRAQAKREAEAQAAREEQAVIDRRHSILSNADSIINKEL